jgi:hypothetical protein
MSQIDNERWFQISMWSAAVLYLWSIFMIWMGPEWGLSGGTFYVMGVLPAVLGVFALCTAVGLHMDISKQEE